MRKSSVAAGVVLALLSAAPAEARIFAGFAGAGPRFRGEEIDPIGNLHASLGVGTLIDLTGDAYGYLSFAGDESFYRFAGASLGLLLSAPIPGPIGIEMGASAGAAQLELDLHGSDELVALFHWEAAGILALGPLKFRIAYQRNFGGTTAESRKAMDSQVLFQIGAGL